MWGTYKAHRTTEAVAGWEEQKKNGAPAVSCCHFPPPQAPPGLLSISNTPNQLHAGQTTHLTRLLKITPMFAPSSSILYCTGWWQYMYIVVQQHKRSTDLLVVSASSHNWPPY